MLDIEDPAALISYLREANRIMVDDDPAVRILTGGVSNRTVLVQPVRGEAFVLKQALGKLRVSVDWYSDPQRIHREALGMGWLQELAPAGTVPRFFFEDRKYHLLAMSAVPLPHENWKTMLLAGRLERQHVRAFGHILGVVHRNAYARRNELAGAFENREFFESLRIEPYYCYTAVQVPESAEFYSKIIDDTRERRITLVHGDYSPKNILIYRGQPILLDHEVIHFGDPAFDVGFSLAHLMSKAHYLMPLRRGFADASREYWDSYSAALGDVPWRDNLEVRSVRHAVGCLLARVQGRSTLEYLDEQHRNVQASAALSLMRNVPATIHDLTGRFLERLGTTS